ncbi:hypothetical protein Taro_009327, partial [Colocasia esculenta]|nr:hypothetical protein [Colocasia esculenta]
MASRPPIPLMRCTCGHGYCAIKMSQTERNPGRMYYKCKEWADRKRRHKLGITFMSPQKVN